MSQASEEKLTELSQAAAEKLKEMSEESAEKLKEMSEASAEEFENDEEIEENSDSGKLVEAVAVPNGSSKAAAKNDSEVHKSYLRSIQFLITETKKANEEMLAHMAQIYEEITHLKTFYEQIHELVNDTFNLTYTKLATQYKLAVRTFPKIPASTYRPSKTEHLTQFARQYNESLKELEQKYTDLVKDVKGDEQLELKLTKLSKPPK